MTSRRSGLQDVEPVVVGVARGGSDAAVRFGAVEARRAGRPLELVHVATVMSGWPRQVGADSLHMALRRARRTGGEHLVVRSRLVVGDPVDGLVDAARRAELLVLENRRPGSLRRRPGSFTESVADLVDVPLVSVPEEWTASDHGIITVGLDVAHPDESAMVTAVRRARLHGAILRVVVADDRSREREVRARAAEILRRLGGDGCDVATEVVDQDAWRALLGVSSRSDVLVLGRHAPAFGDESRLGAVSRHVLRSATCPVWLTTPRHGPGVSVADPAAADPLLVG